MRRRQSPAEYEAAARASVLASIAKARQPEAPLLSLPFRMRRRRREAPIPARLGEGHLMFRLLRNPWRQFRRHGLSLGWQSIGHNHQPSERMPWWPR